MKNLNILRFTILFYVIGLRFLHETWNKILFYVFFFVNNVRILHLRLRFRFSTFLQYCLRKIILRFLLLRLHLHFLIFFKF